MKTLLFKSTLILLTLSLLGCQNESRITYKYTEQPDFILCEIDNKNLYNEAIHSFEADIFKYFDKSNRAPLRAYKKFTSFALNGKLNIEDIASEHSLYLAKQLKKEAQLWHKTKASRTLNYSGILMECIVNNIIDKDLKTTFNALLSTNSIQRNTILTPIKNNSFQLLTDSSLKAFVAFEYYYSALMDIEASQLTVKDKSNTDRTSGDFNHKPTLELKQEPHLKDIHEGHNHD